MSKRAAVLSPLPVLRERVRVRVILEYERLSKFQNHPHPCPLAEYVVPGEGEERRCALSTARSANG
jgi:hypothetical protein